MDKDTQLENAFQVIKTSIINTIKRDIWPTAGCFDEIDKIVNEFESKMRMVEQCKQKR